jgi:hypothetical protein
MLTSFASHLATVTKCNPWIKLSGGPWKYSTPEKLKYSSVQNYGGRVVTVYQIGEQFGTSYKRAATGVIAANGCRATGLFTCDKNIFRPHDFPVASEDTKAAPLNHPALVKTRAVLSCWGSPCIRYQRCAKPEPTTKSSWWNNEENNEFIFTEILLGQFRKRKSNMALNPKPLGLCWMLFLVLQKDGREWFAGIQLRWTLHQIRTLT